MPKKLAILLEQAKANLTTSWRLPYNNANKNQLNKYSTEARLKLIILNICISFKMERHKNFNCCENAFYFNYILVPVYTQTAN